MKRTPHKVINNMKGLFEHIVIIVVCVIAVAALIPKLVILFFNRLHVPEKETPVRNTDAYLHIKTEILDSEVFLYFTGVSGEYEPFRYINPVLNEARQTCIDGNKSLVLDFLNLKYMNSSTITPIIKFLERHAENYNITILYRSDLKWQEVSFTALTLFQSNTIKFKGVTREQARGV